MQSKVSMVMPCYNKAKYIDGMLESIYNQLWDNVELILVNDGSTDGTREIIAEWEPKLRERGYEVVIIDQENQGVGTAVKNGMLRMTGDFFCTVDADDWLYPEYLSTMASWLDEHLDCDYTICGYEWLEGTYENQVVRQVVQERPDFLNLENRLETLLFYRMPAVPWNCLARNSYLLQCKVVENFIESRLSQEPSLVLPLAAGEGNLKIFPQVLYRQFYFDSGRDWKKYSCYYEKRALLYRQVIERMTIEDVQKKRRLLVFCEFSGIKHAYLTSGNFRGRDEEKKIFSTKAAAFVNQYFRPGLKDVADSIYFTGHIPFFSALEDCIMGVQKNPIRERLDAFAGKRVICCAVCGRIAESLLPPLFKTKLKPDILWDAAAGAGESIFGISVEKPSFSDIREDDVFIIPTNNSTVNAQVMSALSETKVRNIVVHSDLVQYISEYYYPSFTNGECKFLFDE